MHDGQFKPGHPGGPGRPKGSVGGRRQMLTEMDKFLADPGRIEELRAAWGRYWAEPYTNPKTGKTLPGPVKFWLDLIQPNLPKNVELDVSTDSGFPDAENFAEFVKRARAEAGAKAGAGNGAPPEAEQEGGQG